MDDIVSAYERPTGTFDSSAAAQVRAGLEARMEELEQSDLVKQLEEALGTTLEEAESGASARRSTPSDRQLLGFVGSGFLRATRICNGWTEPPVADKKTNGFMELVVGFTDSALDPVVFGTLSNCRYLAGGQRTEFTSANPNRSSLNIHLGDTKQSSDFGEHPVTFEINLQGEVAGDSVRLQFDFRVSPETGATEYRVDGDGGDIVVTLDPNRGMRVRARNGEFICGADLDCRNIEVDAGASE